MVKKGQEFMNALLNIRSKPISIVIRKIYGNVLHPSLVVCIFYTAYTLSKLSLHNFNPSAFLYLGRIFLEKDMESPITKFVIQNMGVPPHEVGYDGQVYYYMALDPFNAWRNLDTCGRYQRILYPLTVKAITLGNPHLIPGTMIVVNILSIVVGVEILARMLKSKGFNPWFSLVYGLYIGHIFVIARDCVESFSYMLVLLAIYFLEEKRRPLTSTFLFALALFAKETALMFVVGYILGEIVFKGKRLSLKEKASFFSITLIPYAMFQLFLYKVFGFLPIITVGSPTTTKWIPFNGALEAGHAIPELLNMTFLIFIPSTVACLNSIIAFYRKVFNSTMFAFLLNALFMMFLPTPSYWNLQDYSRISIGLVAAFLIYAIYNNKRRMLVYSLTWIMPFSTYFTYG